MMKRFFSVFLAIILITTLFGCKKAEVPETTTETTQTTTTTTQPVTQAQPKDINPLTGSKKFNPKAIGRRPVAISIENQPQARPQWGITTPDIIIEGETEGGISRMLWLYADYSKVPDKVGPVRSARPSFVVCTELFDSIFIHWGGSHNNKNYKGGYTYIKKHGVDDIDGMKGGKLYGRDKTRSVAIEHRGILYGNRIPSVIKEKKIRKKLNEKKAYILLSVYGFAASIFSFIIGHFWFRSPDNTLLTILFYASLFLIGLQFGAVTLMPMIMTADCVDYYEYETGKRMEGAAYSILTLTIKVCLALGTALGLVFVGISGYSDTLKAIDAGTATGFDTKTKDIIFFAYTALPGILALLSTIPMFKYDIVGEKKELISKTLGEKRTQE